MLNKDTRNVLKNLGSIGNSAIIRYPITTVLQLDKSLVAFVDLEKLGETEFDEFGLYFMSDFLGLADFYKDADINLENGILKIENANSSQRYQTTDLSSMELFDLPVKVLENIETQAPEVEFEIDAEQLDSFKKISTLAKTNSLVVDADLNSNINVVICSLDENGTYMNESKNVLDNGVINSKTKIEFQMQNIFKLPNYNYKVKIIKNQKTGNYISLWESKESPVKIIVAVTKSLI